MHTTPQHTTTRRALSCTRRYSFVGAMPAMEVVATGNRVVTLDHEKGTRDTRQEADPMQVMSLQLIWYS